MNHHNQALQEQLEQALLQIASHETNLHLAGQLGSSLLSENTLLKTQHANLIAAATTAFGKRYADLENTHADLLATHEKHLETHRILIDREAHVCENLTIALLDCTKREEDISKLSANALQSTLERAALKAEIARSATENSRLNNLLLAANQKYTDATADLNTLTGKHTCDRNAFRELDAEKSGIEMRLGETESLLEVYRGYQAQSEQQTITITEMNAEIEDLRGNLFKLQSKIPLNTLTNNDDEYVESGSKTLLGEIDDQRKELLGLNLSLSEKHADLEKSHHVTLIQKGKIQNHLTRLKQVSRSDSSTTDLVRMMRNQLTQSENEKSELIERVQFLESNKNNTNTAVTSHRSQDYGSAYEVLKRRFDSLASDHEMIGIEMQRLRLIKTSETDKLNEVFGLLNLKQAELDATRLHYSGVQYELDELKFGLEIAGDRKAYQAHESLFEGDKNADQTQDLSHKVHGSVGSDNLANEEMNAVQDLNSVGNLVDVEAMETGTPNDYAICEDHPDFQTAPETPGPAKTSVTEYLTKLLTPVKSVRMDRSKVQECNQQ